ncbi:MAG: sigma 54-dependent Fis family transcriptional regulator [Syntrophobacterales bacterium]|nr:MAG: sigma 54-dependent Fis family transcriptional regulator [Syntrophobacterales bacterium]
MVVIAGTDLQKTFAIEGKKVTIGSQEDNHCILNDPTVSRHHAVIEETGKGYILRDVGSTNGTHLNGIRIKEAYLEYGSIIGLGNTQLQFVPLEGRVEIPPSEEDCFGDVFGRSLEMRRIFTMLKKISPSDITVTIEGETGTGKELVARGIHSHSQRAEGPFVVIDCGSISKNLIESELFGHERGAFTGATQTRRGAFEIADGGTIFIDEIGELGLEMQPKLLRVLEQREVRRVGGTEVFKVNVRVIAATNKDLVSEVQKGRFREDLFYRISVVRIHLPPLKEKGEDIPLLAQQFARELTERYRGGGEVTVSAEALEILRHYHWPGNVRELKNVITRAMAMGNERVLQLRDFIMPLPSEGRPRTPSLDSLIGKTLEEIEKAAIMKTLKAHGGNKSAAARVLGIAYSTLYEKIKKYGLS